MCTSFGPIGLPAGCDADLRPIRPTSGRGGRPPGSTPPSATSPLSPSSTTRFKTRAWHRWHGGGTREAWRAARGYGQRVGRARQRRRAGIARAARLYRTARLGNGASRLSCRVRQTIRSRSDRTRGSAPPGRPRRRGLTRRLRDRWSGRFRRSWRSTLIFSKSRAMHCELPSIVYRWGSGRKSEELTGPRLLRTPRFGSSPTVWYRSVETPSPFQCCSTASTSAFGPALAAQTSA